MTSKAVAKTTDYAVAVRSSMENAAVMREALAPGETLDFTDLPRVKVPSGGGKNWELPDGSAAQTLEGVIVLRQPVRAFWKDSYASSGGGTPPDCSSMDLVNGQGDNGQGSGIHQCATCPMAAFGTATNDKGEPAPGQACRQITRIFLLREGQALPTLVPVPPSSSKATKSYAVSNASEGYPLWSVVTEIGLDQDKSQGGISYSKATFRRVRPLDDDEREAADRYRRELGPVFGAMPIIDVDAT